MAKHKNNSYRNRRVIRVNANRRLPLRSISYRPVRLNSSLMQYEDRRLYHPRDPRPALVIGQQNPARYRHSSSRRARVPVGVAFQAPERVLVCVRRKRRREVMFAKGGAGQRRMRRPRRNQFSDVRC